MIERVLVLGGGTAGWMTGFPPRTGFGRGYPEHDPWRFEAAGNYDEKAPWASHPNFDGLGFLSRPHALRVLRRADLAVLLLNHLPYFLEQI